MKGNIRERIESGEWRNRKGNREKTRKNRREQFPDDARAGAFKKAMLDGLYARTHRALVSPDIPPILQVITSANNAMNN